MSNVIIPFYWFEWSTKKVGEYLSKVLNIPCEEIRAAKDIAFFYTDKGGTGKAVNKIETGVNINKKLISLYGLTNVENDFENLKDGVLSWAKGLF